MNIEFTQDEMEIFLIKRDYEIVDAETWVHSDYRNIIPIKNNVRIAYKGEYPYDFLEVKTTECVEKVFGLEAVFKKEFKKKLLD